MTQAATSSGLPACEGAPGTSTRGALSPTRPWKLARRLAALSLKLSVVAALAGWLAFVAFHDELIDETRFAIPHDAYSILDREGAPLRHQRQGGGGLDRRWVALDRVDRDLIDAVVAAEDQRFFSHGGVDVLATVRAAGQDLVPGGRRSGASTITQQLVKLVYGRPHGAASKGLEILRAIELEDRLGKDEILEQYLNRLPYGNGLEGIERAAEAYFGRPASELTLGEAALLAGLPQAPSRLDPRRHLGRAIARRDHVLGRMLALGLRTPEEIRLARAERPAIRRESPRSYRAPRFVDAVVARVQRGELTPERGTITTTLDLPLEGEVEEVLAGTVARLRGRGASNGAAIVVVHATGEIRAYVGAVRSGPDAEGGQLDLLRARRQPGSTLKPLVYALFFDRGASPSTIVDDLRAPMTGRSGALYTAENYDGTERGPVSARMALAGSLNLASLDVARRLGQDHLVRGLGGFGIARGRDANELGAAVVLGGADVSALELAEAYATLARGGTRIPLRTTPLAGGQLEPRRVVSADAAALVRDVLADREARRAGFGRELMEGVGQGEVALKTGTSQGWHDAWAAAFDDDFTVVVWIGDPSGDAMERVSGFEAAAPTAMRILGRARARRDELVSADAQGPAAEASLPGSSAPEGLVHAHVCAHTGLRPGPRCTHVVDDVFAHGRVPTHACDAHAEDGAVLLGDRYAGWIERTSPLGMRLRGRAAGAPSAEPRVTYPEDGAVLVAAAGTHPRIPLRAVVGVAQRSDARFEVDGRPVEGGGWALETGTHAVVAIVDGRRSASVQFEVRRQ